MLSTAIDTYQYLMDIKDPRTVDWFLVVNPFAEAFFVLIYVLFSIYGPRLMKNYKPLNLKYVLVAYNLLLVCLSAYMFFEILIVSFKSNYSYTCQPCDYSNEELPLRMAKVIWLHYISKFIEFADTVFFVLRKKNQQLTFLHIYHHCTVVLMWWACANWSPGGHVFFPAMLNSLIHTIMYVYYFLTVFGDWIQPYLFWKRYLTQLQVIQLVSMAIHYSLGAYYNCFGSNAFLIFGTLYIISLCVLFVHYYISTYRKSKQQLEAKKTT